MYSFSGLDYKELPEADDKETIFLTSEKLLKQNNFTGFNDPVACMTEKLNEGETYYVIHEHIIHKGKSKILKGKIVLSDKKSLLKYLDEIISDDDIRPFRIMPVEKQNFVITITDEGTALYFK